MAVSENVMNQGLYYLDWLLDHKAEFKLLVLEKFNKATAWEYVYDDAFDIVARIPIIAAFIYNLKYRSDFQVAMDRGLDMGANFAQMIGQCDEYKDVAKAAP